MTSQDVERRLTQILHDRAEAAMSLTDTQDELRELLMRGGHEPPSANGRRRFVAVVAAAAAAAALFWAVDVMGVRDEPSPVERPRVDAIEVTERFLAAYTSNDLDTVTKMAADPDDLAGWRIAMARDQAWNVQFMFEPCREVTTVDIGTGVLCPFSLHVLGSEEVGRGPFENAHFTVWVDETGGVFEADPTWNFQYNGMNSHVEEATSWVWAQHPEQADFLMLDEPDVPPGQYDRWLGLWERYLQDYVEAHRQG